MSLCTYIVLVYPAYVTHPVADDIAAQMSLRFRRDNFKTRFVALRMYTYSGGNAENKMINNGQFKVCLSKTNLYIESRAVARSDSAIGKKRKN